MTRVTGCRGHVVRFAFVLCNGVGIACEGEGWENHACVRELGKQRRESWDVDGEFYVEGFWEGAQDTVELDGLQVFTGAPGSPRLMVCMTAPMMTAPMLLQTTECRIFPLRKSHLTVSQSRNLKKECLPQSQANKKRAPKEQREGKSPTATRQRLCTRHC